MTNYSHTFVTSISTADVVSLLLQRYAELSERSQEAQRTASQSAVEEIKIYKRNKTVLAEFLIDEVLRKIERMDDERSAIMQPFAAINTIAKKLFRYKGIKITDRMNIGEAVGAIDSEALSAGEKQMLSFIAYNAFNSDSIIFIDEPKLSLHVDWQRQLFPILLNQGTSNQFIIATHSPFIYAKYEEKEIMLSSTRGYSEY